MNVSKCCDPRFWKKWRASDAVGALTFDRQKHPELCPGEVYITNTDASGYHRIGWRTKRAGFVALDSLGRPISDRAWQGAFPVFASADELAAKGVFVTHEPKLVRYYPPM
jgi:hypothetical protein